MKGQQRQSASISPAHPASSSSQHPANDFCKDHALLSHPQTCVVQPHSSSTFSSLPRSATPQTNVKHLPTTDSRVSISSLSSTNSYSSSNSSHNLHTVHRVPPSTQTAHNFYSDTPPTISATSSTSEAACKHEPSSSSGDGLTKKPRPKQESQASERNPSHRTRNHNSSSFSDGDVPTSPEGATSSLSGTGEDTQEKRDCKWAATPDIPTFSSSKGKKSKKKGRKTKKSGKKEPTGQSSSSASSQSKERSEASKRRRAHVLQRIRRDSWNTSSDEDHTLSSNNSSESLSQCDSVFLESSQTTDLKKEDQNAQCSVDHIKEHLRKRIFSKKPPTYFETPATDPIYHEASFVVVVVVPLVAEFMGFSCGYL